MNRKSLLEKSLVYQSNGFTTLRLESYKVINSRQSAVDVPTNNEEVTFCNVFIYSFNVNTEFKIYDLFQRL